MQKSKIKQLAYITSMATGGLAGFNYKELVELQRLGVDTTLFVTKFRPGPYMAPAGVPTHCVRQLEAIAKQPEGFFRSPGRYVSLAIEALRTNTLQDFLIAQVWVGVMRSRKCDWIHCHWGDHKLYIGYYCHKLTGLPLSVTLHGYDLYANPNWLMLERALNACTQIITISNYNKELLKKKFGALGERIKVIRLFTEQVADPGDQSQITKLLIVGGFQYRKGYDVLLEALKRLDRKDIHLWVVGYKGPVDVRGMIQKLGLNDRVTVFGHISDEVLKLLYVYCDIFCMPSRMDKDGVGEGLPVSLMEAMSYAKPVVSTYHTGIPELVPDILVPEDDVKGLAEGIAKLADNPGLRAEMGRRNRRIVAEQYSRDNVNLLLEALQCRS